jgi:UDP-glucose 4-epimerase
MLNKIDNNEEPQINGDGTQAYDFVSVEDVARANLAAMESDKTDEFYNVGTGIQTTIKELCDLILALKDSKLMVKYNPYSAEDSRRMVQNRIGSTKKIQKDLNFEPAVSLEAGIKNLISWRDANTK